MKLSAAMTFLFLSLFAVVTWAEEDIDRRAPASYRPKSLTDEATGQDRRDPLPSIVSPTDESSESGIEFGLIYKGELSSVMSGGLNQHSSHLENLDVRLNLDLNKIAGLKGASVFIYGLGNRGANDTSTPMTNVGDIQGTSNIETGSSQFILYEAWYQQMFFEDKVSILLGLHDLNSEFYAADSAGIFFNSSFGVGKDLSQTGANGPSIFPVTSTAVRLKVEPSENFYIQTAVFNGQSGDPNDSQATHIRGFGDDGLLTITETGVLNVGGRNSKYALGMWSYDKTFEAIGDPSKQVSSKGAYGVADLELIKDLSVFFKYGRASTESNDVGACLAAGLQWKHIFSDSWHDRFGLGVAQAYFGKEYLADQEAAGVNTSDVETALELTYRFEVTPWLALQPDFQYVITPSGNRDIPDAQVGTLRVEIGI